nr:transposase [Pseudomonas sp. GM55]
MLFVFLNRHRNRVKILYWEHTAFAFGSSVWSRNVSKHRPIPPTRPSC